MLSLNLIIFLLILSVLVWGYFIFKGRKKGFTKSIITIGEFKQICQIVTKEIKLSELLMLDKKLNPVSQNPKMVLTAEGTALIVFDLNDIEMSSEKTQKIKAIPKLKIRFVDINIKLLSNSSKGGDLSFNKAQRIGKQVLEREFRKSIDLQSSYLDFYEKIQIFLQPYQTDLVLPKKPEWVEGKNLEIVSNIYSEKYDYQEDGIKEAGTDNTIIKNKEDDDDLTLNKL